jgi:hypothetical protein
MAHAQQEAQINVRPEEQKLNSVLHNQFFGAAIVDVREVSQ